MKKFLLLFFLSSALLIAAGNKKKQKIILDCDFGGDIDDAFAVALILSSPEFEVLGFVMDHGNTPLRARTICKLLYETGKEDIPVIVGKPTPAIVGVDTSIAGYSYQFYWSEEFNKLKPSKTSAADFIINNLTKYPNEVILFTVGPVCNIEDVLKKDKNALKLAKRVVSMFGSFYMGYDSGPVPNAEWNVRADVEASKMFVSSGAKITFAGLDVTTFVKLDEKNLNMLLFRQSPLTNALCGLYSLWRKESYAQPEANLFDVVAVGSVLWPELFTSRKTNIRVDDKGYTLIDDSKEPNAEILMTINKDEFTKKIMDRYITQNLHR
ncbi:MAG: nucleoside hydrolase [Ignavibacteriaceae bacterium]